MARWAALGLLTLVAVAVLAPAPSIFFIAPAICLAEATFQMAVPVVLVVMLAVLAETARLRLPNLTPRIRRKKVWLVPEFSWKKNTV
jgi:hypothetical protein